MKSLFVRSIQRYEMRIRSVSVLLLACRLHLKCRSIDKTFGNESSDMLPAERTGKLSESKIEMVRSWNKLHGRTEQNSKFYI